MASHELTDQGGQLVLQGAPCHWVANPFYSPWFTPMALWHTPVYLKVPNCYFNITWTLFNMNISQEKANHSKISSFSNP